VRGEQSTEVLDLRIECLLEALRDLSALCRLFRSATAEVVENAVSAAMALPSPERCRNIELLRAVVRPPADAAAHAAVTALRTLIGDLRALHRVGRYRDALEQCGRVVEEARRLGYGPTLAEVLFVQGTLHTEAGRADAALDSLDEAVWCAELARHDEVAAQAATYIVYTSGYLQARFDLAETWCRHTEMLLRRMGGHDDLWGWYLNNRAAMRKAQGNLAGAIDDARAAIAAKSRAFGPDSHDVGISMNNLSGYLVEAGSIAEGIETSRRGIEVLTNGLGPEHPKTALALSNHGELLCRTRRFAEALDYAHRALAIFERETDPNGPFVAHSLWVIGVSASNAGAFDRALPVLERAREIREDSNAIALELGEVHLALGRALFDGGVDRERGMALVLRARQEYQQAPRTPFVDGDLAELNRWLAARH
jgi:tetratricopeptide (TPR) repeat protein